MSNVSKKPHYVAAVISSTGEDFGPINIDDALDDINAGNLAMERGAKQIAASGLDQATIQITKNGEPFRSIPVDSRK